MWIRWQQQHPGLICKLEPAALQTRGSGDSLIGSFKMNVYGHYLNQQETDDLFEIVENIEWLEECETCADIECW